MCWAAALFGELYGVRSLEIDTPVARIGLASVLTVVVTLTVAVILTVLALAITWRRSVELVRIIRSRGRGRGRRGGGSGSREVGDALGTSREVRSLGLGSSREVEKSDRRSRSADESRRGRRDIREASVHESHR